MNSAKSKQREVYIKLKNIELREQDFQDLDMEVSRKISSVTDELRQNITEVNNVISKIKEINSTLNTKINSISNNPLLSQTKIDTEKDKIINEASTNMLYYLNSLVKSEERCSLKVGDILKALDQVKKSKGGTNFLGGDL